VADELTQIRLAQNQSIFRGSNERIEAAADAIGLYESVPFICECPVTRCTELVRMAMDEYERVRQDPPGSSLRQGMRPRRSMQARPSCSNEERRTS
jgi:hypothetical protein